MKTLETLLGQFNAQPEIIRPVNFENIDKATNRHGGQVIFRMSGTFIAAIWSSDEGWDHVSVSHRKRTPKYQEMKAMKRFFFERDEWAVEYHPPDDDYISHNDNVLHLWRPHGVQIPTPPKIFV